METKVKNKIDEILTDAYESVSIDLLDYESFMTKFNKKIAELMEDYNEEIS